MFIRYVYVLSKSQLAGCLPVSQAPVIHLPEASVLVECVSAGTHAPGEMEAQVAHYYR